MATMLPILGAYHLTKDTDSVAGADR